MSPILEGRSSHNTSPSPLASNFSKDQFQRKRKFLKRDSMFFLQSNGFGSQVSMGSTPNFNGTVTPNNQNLSLLDATEINISTSKMPNSK